MPQQFVNAPQGEWFLARILTVVAGTPKTYTAEEWWQTGDTDGSPGGTGPWKVKTGGRVLSTDNPGYAIPAADLTETLLAVGDFAWARSADGRACLNFELVPATSSSATVSAWKETVRCATIASGTLASSFENGDVIDGVTLATGDRILIKNQSFGGENGIYVVASSGSPTRATDCDSSEEFVGAITFVSEGFINKDTIWECTTDATITVDSTSTVWDHVRPAVTAWKPSARVATTAFGTLSTAFENGDTVDGVTLATGDRILIKNQSSAENGIYVVNASGSPTRALDCDSSAEFVGAAVWVSEGTVNADTIWVCTTNATITVGSTTTAWSQYYPNAGIAITKGVVTNARQILDGCKDFNANLTTDAITFPCGDNGATATTCYVQNSGDKLQLSATDIIEFYTNSGNLTFKFSLDGMIPPTRTNAGAANGAIFYSSDGSKLAYKDPGGTVHYLY